MALLIINDMRRNIGAIETLAKAGVLTPEKLHYFLLALETGVECVEAYLDSARVSNRDLEPPPRIPGRPFLAWSNPAGGAA
jgi:hypothetical protein